jgi:hypothetical protein
VCGCGKGMGKNGRKQQKQRITDEKHRRLMCGCGMEIERRFHWLSYLLFCVVDVVETAVRIYAFLVSHNLRARRTLDQSFLKGKELRVQIHDIHFFPSPRPRRPPRANRANKTNFKGGYRTAH